ncbi:hypothetical protein N7535_000562 [Penicillium sp. DV-2018c]|nr:hypothetical protein N7535_000562 [Penicillium sp. DV-2018c]
MARMKHGVFSWEDVLAQRYQKAAEPQLQSRLLARLSPELRLMIWGFVLADQRIHIIQLSRQRLGHVVCAYPVDLEKASRSSSPAPRQNHHTRQDSAISCEICHGPGIAQPARESDLARAGDKVKLLALALTCRQIPQASRQTTNHKALENTRYHESISLLYTLPTFEFSNPWTLPYLLPTLPCEARALIRKVELRWSFPGHWLPSKDSVRAVYVSAGRAQWTETCLALSQLSSLRSFVLVLESNWFCEPVERLIGFLEPLRGIVVRSVGRRSWERAQGPVDAGMDGCNSRDRDSGSEDSTDGESCGSLALRPSLSSIVGSCSKSRFAGSGLSRCVGKWELRLQGQSYYMHELDWAGDDLQRRGIECWISTV